MYCTKCGYEIDAADKFCKKCGTPVNPPAPVQQQSDQTLIAQASGYEATVQKPSGYHPPMQHTAQHQIPVATNRDIWGRFGGLMVYGALIIFTFIIGAILSTSFLNPINIGNIGRQIVMLLPVGFAVGLTVMHKGVDFSLPAMASLSCAICCMTDNLSLGILLSLMACILIGAINAVCIHYLKLPGMLVTLPIYLIVSFVVNSLVLDKRMDWLDIAPDFLFVVALISAIVAVGIALLSSMGKDSRSKFFTTLVVYAGSGVLAVLYIIGLSIRVGALRVYDTSWLITTILLIAIFLSLSRFFKSKVLGVVLAIIPVVFEALLNNVMLLFRLSTYSQHIVLLVIILILLFVLLYRGRAQLIGQSLEKKYWVKSWIAFIPLLLLLTKSVIMGIAILINPNNFPFLSRLSYIYPYVILLVAVGICIVHALVKPKGSNII